jgi:hypothetical protein
MDMDLGVSIEMDLREAGSEILGFLGFWDKIHWWDVLNTVINIKFRERRGVCRRAE